MRYRSRCRTEIAKLPDEIEEIIKLSDDIVKWIEQTRFIKGEPMSMKGREQMAHILRDPRKDKRIVKSRQVEATEHLGVNWLLHKLSKHPGTVGLYLSDRDSHTSKFSSLRLKTWAIENSAVIQRQVVPLKLHTATVQPFYNGSVLYMHSAWGDFEQARSVPADFAVVDEIQSVKVEKIGVLREAMSHSKFAELVQMGTGSEEGSAWHQYWLEGDQAEWDSKLKRFVPKKPENSDIASYRIEQINMPWIKVKDYWAKRKHYTTRDWTTEVLGWWFKGAAKPLTVQDMKALFDKTQSLLAPEEIDHNRGPLFIGVDWGGGVSAFTIVWIVQLIDERIPLFKLVYVEKIDEPDVTKQAERVARLIDQYKPRQGVMDGGGGTKQVQYLEEQFGHKMAKCFYDVRPGDPLNFKDLAEHNKFTVDRTWAIETTIDLIKRPYEIEPGRSPIPKLIIPHKEPDSVEWIIDMFTCIERISYTLSSGKKYTRFEHSKSTPDDAVHAQNYSYLAWLISKRTLTRQGVVEIGTMGGGGP